MRGLTALALFLALTACGRMESAVTFNAGTSTNPSLYMPAQWNQVAAQEAPGCKDTLADGKAADRETLCRLVSNYRQSFGLAPVRLAVSLGLAAQLHADDMNLNMYFSHTSPTGGSVTERVAVYGITNATIGENIARGQESAEAVFQAWIDSPGHRANILARDFSLMGIGRAETYWVQVFSNK